MRQGNAVQTLSIKAAVKLNRGVLVTLAGAIAAAAKDAHGVAQTDAEIGDLVAVTVAGTAVAKAAAAITAGQRVQVGANGTITPHTTGVPVGIAIENAAANAETEFLFASLGAASAAA